MRGLGLADEYRTDTSDLVAGLWVPCLSVGRRYDRAVGYFTSSGLAAAARGLDAFVDHDGIMRLVASPVLQPDDVAALEFGLAARADVLERLLLREFSQAPGDAVTRRLAYLSWLIAERRLEIRIAVPTSARSGIYHEKVAVFRDHWEDAVAVVGSPNETAGGLVENFESVDVYKSWDKDSARVDQKARHFDRLWEDDTSGLEVIELPDAIVRRLIEFAPPSLVRAATQAGGSDRAGRTRKVKPVTLRTYQAAAIEAWEAAGRHGILAMATGTGKTLTALAATRRLMDESPRPIVVLILAPLVHLVQQWAEAARAWGLRPIECYGSSADWLPKAQAALDYLRANSIDSMCLVSTHASAALPALKGVIASAPASSVLVIADELHHLGSERRYAALPQRAGFRLGLSATPERWDDVEGTARLFDYFGGIVYTFDIQAAIAEGVLAPYEYHPVLVPLTPDELADYLEVAEAIGAQLDLPPEKRDFRTLAKLMRARSEVLDTASGKIAALRDALAGIHPEHTLVYCSGRKQLAAAMDLMWERGIAARQFTGEELDVDRSQLLADFAMTRTPVLVAIRCLDEGVDIPQATRAHLLASSGNPLQFVQRRGRLLRRWESKNQAVIVDYVVIPAAAEGSESVLVRELQRVAEFAASATNRSEALEILWPVLRHRGLLHLVGSFDGRS